MAITAAKAMVWLVGGKRGTGSSLEAAWDAYLEAEPEDLISPPK
jgi:hypothetical protein